MPRLVGELDDACAPLLDAAERAGARVWVVSEYGHCDVSRPVAAQPRSAGGGLARRSAPVRSARSSTPFTSRAFAVCDHQLAHVYVHDAADIEPRPRPLAAEPGVARVLVGEERAELGLDHPRSGELVLLSEPDAWFAYPFWLDDRDAPDYARTVDIHRKPGYDPCELFFDPKLHLAQGRAIRRLVAEEAGLPDAVRRRAARPDARPR